MVSFAVDSKGKRITTDILVAGYIRDFSTDCDILIPEDIASVCFVFWLIKVCDEWDKEFSSKTVTIDGQIAIVPTGTEIHTANVYGCQRVSEGTCTWEFKLPDPSQWFCLGLIEDDPEVLKEFANTFSYDEEHGCFLDRDGDFWCHKGSNIYCDLIEKVDTIITMTLDMDHHAISYTINGKDCGIATDELDKDKYRMIATFGHNDFSIELL